jgi:hypothetical protein
MTFTACPHCDGKGYIDERPGEHGGLRRHESAQRCDRCRLGCSSYDSTSALCRDCSTVDRACLRGKP